MAKRTRILVYMSLLIALSVVLMRVMSFRITIGGIEGIRIGLGSLPIIFAGIALGPVFGGIVGMLTDVVGYLASPMGGYMPLISLAYFLVGFIPGAVSHYLLKGSDKYWPILTAVLCGQLITSVLIIPYLLFLFFDLPLVATRVPKIFQVLLEAPFYAYFIKSLLGFKPLKSLGISHSG